MTRRALGVLGAVWNIANKTVVLTGPTSGIGLETARRLAQKDARLILVGRNRDKLTALQRELGGQHPAVVCDLAELHQVRRAIIEIQAHASKIDVLINNAGAIHTERKLTSEGYELTFAANHLGPFLLTEGLRPQLLAAAPARIINVASNAHYRGHLDFADLMHNLRYSAWSAYCASKLANVLHARVLAEQLTERGVTANSLHPGVIASGFGHNNQGWAGILFKLGGPFLASNQEGAKTTLHLALSEEGGTISGKYFAKSKQKTPSKEAQDSAVARQLWETSLKLTQAA